MPSVTFNPSTCCLEKSLISPKQKEPKISENEMRIHRYESISMEVLQNTEDVPEKLWLLSNHAPKKIFQV